MNWSNVFLGIELWNVDRQRKKNEMLRKHVLQLVVVAVFNFAIFRPYIIKKY